MAKLVIGASISNKHDASAEVDGLFKKLDFPCDIQIANNSSSDLYIPSLQMKKIKPFSKRVFVIQKYGVLVSAVVELSQFARLRNAQNFAVVTDEIEQVEAEQQPEPEPEPSEKLPLDDGLPEPEQPEPEPIKNIDAQSGVQLSPLVDDVSAIHAELVSELENGDLLVAVGDVEFEVKKTQLRADKTLTAGGLKAYETAKGV